MAKILVLEDNPAIGMVIKIALTDEGHQVELRKNAFEGLALMKSELIPDLVLTDLLMGGMDGRDLIKKMRDDQRLRNIPTVIITGCVPNSDVMPEEHQFQGLLMKPFDIDELVGIVASLVQTEGVHHEREWMKAVSL